MLADIFCRVIDNYGDIGFCWRLAKQLQKEYSWNIRIWVDDLYAFGKIQPGIINNIHYQIIKNVPIIWWNHVNEKGMKNFTPGNVIIETFQCGIPSSYLNFTFSKKPILINIEHLTAETWIDTCHKLKSFTKSGLEKIFYFPGFSKLSGGLIRENWVSKERNSLQSSWNLRLEFLRNIGLFSTRISLGDYANVFLCTIFCYQNAPVYNLINILEKMRKRTILLVPEGISKNLENSCKRTHWISIFRFPFLKQKDFDRILWCSDLNFIRGEDSLVRAIWSQRPFIWQIYKQKKLVHLNKLEAWLRIYQTPSSVAQLFRSWNMGMHKMVECNLNQALSSDWIQWKKLSKNSAREFEKIPDLSKQLVELCRKY